MPVQQRVDQRQLFYCSITKAVFQQAISCAVSIRSRPRRRRVGINLEAAWAVDHVLPNCPSTAPGIRTAATNAGIDKDTVGKLLNHGGRSVTSRYIKTSYLGRMLAAAQEDISAHLVRALGSPRGMA